MSELNKNHILPNHILPNHILPYDNQNQAIVAEDNEVVPLGYFNRIKLNSGETHSYQLANYESVCVMVSGGCNITVGEEVFQGLSRNNLWVDPADSVYIPAEQEVTITGTKDNTEIFVAGGIVTNEGRSLTPFRVSPTDVEQIQYGSDDTKTHRKIKHILGKNTDGKVDRLLVSELFTVGKGGWSGFPPHKHDTDRLPDETRHDEIYHYRFNPGKGFAAQFLYAEGESGPAHHVLNESTFLIDKGYHPIVVAPGYEMYYFTILIGASQRPLVQYFEPAHEEQVYTIPGIKDMVAGFK